ncbi:hypothetical protein KSS87_002343 [Heliosperma pusillum]|nr:hypothetical protein KSS87_002343 [Heliosperma pusillum]
MASCNQTQCDLAASSVSSPQTTSVSVGPSPAVVSHNATNGHTSSPFMPFHVPLIHAGDFRRNRQNVTSPSAYDLNTPFDMNVGLDQDPFFTNDSRFMNYQSSDFSGSGFDLTMDSGMSSSMMNNDDVRYNSFPHLQSTSNANMVSFAGASRGGVGNFHTTPNFSVSGVRRSKSGVISGAHDNQVGVNVPQIDNVDTFDGRFLSLGNQSNSTVNTNFSAYREFPSPMSESPFVPSVQQTNYSHVCVGERLPGFPNSFHNGGTPMDMCGNSTFAQSDLQAMPSASAGRPDPMLLGGQVNMHHLMANERRKMPELKEESGLRISSSDASEQMRTVPFNSSVLRSNHRNSANPLKKVYVRSNKVLPLTEDTSGVAKQDKSGKFSPNVASYVGAAERCKMSEDRVPQLANEGGAVTIEDQISHSSTPVLKGLSKRSLYPPQQALTHNQRRKFIAQSSAHQFSSHLLQNALGQISSSQSMPLRPISASSSLEGIVYNNSTLNPTPLLPPSRHEGPTVTRMLEHHAAFPGSAMSSLTSFRNASSMPVPPPISAAEPAALPRNVTCRRIDNSRILDPVSGRVVSGRLPLLNNNPSPVTIPSKAYFPRTDSNLMITPTVAALRKPPHALTTPVKASPPYPTQRSTAMAPHIKLQVSETSPMLGLKCMLCKRDLSYAPEGPISIPPIPPHVAVLPCGHSFHDHCLLLITPKDQSKDPPCIPCAIGDS